MRFLIISLLGFINISCSSSYYDRLNSSGLQEGDWTVNSVESSSSEFRYFRKSALLEIDDNEICLSGKKLAYEGLLKQGQKYLLLTNKTSLLDFSVDSIRLKGKIEMYNSKAFLLKIYDVEISDFVESQTGIDDLTFNCVWEKRYNKLVTVEKK